MVAVSRQRNQRRKFLYKIRNNNNNNNKKRIFVFFRGQGIFTFMFHLTRKVLDIVKELRLFIFIGAKRFAGSSASGMDFFEDLGWLNSVNRIQHEYIHEFFHYRPFYS